MGSVSDPFWMLVFRPEGTNLTVTSPPVTRRTGEDENDAMERLLGNRDVLEALEEYTETVGPIKDDDIVDVYKIGDGQRKTPNRKSVKDIRNWFDVDLTTAL